MCVQSKLYLFASLKISNSKSRNYGCETLRKNPEVRQQRKLVVVAGWQRGKMFVTRKWRHKLLSRTTFFGKFLMEPNRTFYFELLERYQCTPANPNIKPQKN